MPPNCCQKGEMILLTIVKRQAVVLSLCERPHGAKALTGGSLSCAQGNGGEPVPVTGISLTPLWALRCSQLLHWF